MSKYTVTLTSVEEKALLTEMGSIQDWIDNAIHNRARIAINKIVSDITNLHTGKLTVAERHDIVRKAVVKTAAEKEQEFLASLPIRRK